MILVKAMLNDYTNWYNDAQEKTKKKLFYFIFLWIAGKPATKAAAARLPHPVDNIYFVTSNK